MVPVMKRLTIGLEGELVIKVRMLIISPECSLVSNLSFRVALPPALIFNGVGPIWLKPLFPLHFVYQ